MGAVRGAIIPWGLDTFLTFPNLLSSYLKSLGNSYIPCLKLIIAHRFTCGESKIW